MSSFEGASNRSESIVQHCVKKTQELSTDWTSLVDDILDEVEVGSYWVRLCDSHRLARAQGYIRSVVYKSDNKDVFQRRNRKRSR